MRPIPAPRIGDSHGLLRAIDERGRLRLDEFVTDFSVEDLFPPGLENALGRTRQFVSYARSAGLLKEDRGTVELTDVGGRYVKAGDAEQPFDVSPAQAEWLRRQLREKHMTDSIYHGLAIGLSLLSSVPPGTRVSTLDFGRSLGYLGRAGWDNENTLLGQGERYLTLLRDLELIDEERSITPTGGTVKCELTLPIHMSLLDIAGQLNPGGPDAVRAEGESEWSGAPRPRVGALARRAGRGGTRRRTTGTRTSAPVRCLQPAGARARLAGPERPADPALRHLGHRRPGRGHARVLRDPAGGDDARARAGARATTTPRRRPDRDLGARAADAARRATGARRPSNPSNRLRRRSRPPAEPSAAPPVEPVSPPPAEPAPGAAPPPRLRQRRGHPLRRGGGRAAYFPRGCTRAWRRLLPPASTSFSPARPAAGKTTLALAVARAASGAGRSDGAVMVTAAKRWSARDTLGRRPRDGEVEPGLVVDAASRGKWLVIDELDRAQLDRALGPLSTFLAGLPVTLPDGGEAKPPEDWRIVATATAFGGGSPALLRRFAQSPSRRRPTSSSTPRSPRPPAATRRPPPRSAGCSRCASCARSAPACSSTPPATPPRRNAITPTDERTLAREAVARVRRAAARRARRRRAAAPRELLKRL